MWGEGQVLQTLGLPEGPRRAKLVVTEPTQTCALYAAHDGNSNIIIKNIQVSAVYSIVRRQQRQRWRGRGQALKLTPHRVRYRSMALVTPLASFGVDMHWLSLVATT